MSESVLTYLDSYCERAGDPAAFAEPLNFLTNGFFILAAVIAVRALKKHAVARKQIDLWLLGIFLFAIGVGSGLWHWRPNGMTLLMDVIPITLFMNLYLLSALRRLFALSWVRVLGWWGLYVAVTILAQRYLPPDVLHGTVMYLPTYAVMVALTYGVTRRNAAMGKVFAGITLVWTLSLVARTIDLEICTSLSIGTHFIWHTLNAWVLWRLLMLLIRGR
jgi:hypothetical protein